MIDDHHGVAKLGTAVLAAGVDGWEHMLQHSDAPGLDTDTVDLLESG